MFDRVFREAGWPEAKAIVMLAGEDQFLHARLPRDADDLAGIEVGRIENVLTLIAVAPFLAGKSIDGEMSKTDELHLLPLKLARAGHRPDGAGGGTPANDALAAMTITPVAHRVALRFMYSAHSCTHAREVKHELRAMSVFRQRNIPTSNLRFHPEFVFCFRYRKLTP